MQWLKFDAKTVWFMVFNFVSSTVIVFINKILFKDFNCHFSTFVTCCHFVFTYLGTLVAERGKMFEHKQLNHMDVLPITIAFCGFVVFNNLSLQHNSVGFYQLMKVVTTPVIVVLQYFIYGVKEDRRLILSLIPVVIGVILATVNDVSFNLVGFFWAVAGVLSTSFYQMFVKSKQDSLGANSWQLLKYQAPQAAAIVALITPLFDQVRGEGGLVEYFENPPPGALLVLVTSSVLAFCVNLSIFLVVGRTNPITYNVLGHFKLVVILSGGIIWLGEDRQPKRLFGMFLAFVGIVQYTHLKQTIANTWTTKDSSSTKSKVDDANGNNNNNKNDSSSKESNV